MKTMDTMNLDGLLPWGGLGGATFDAADMVVVGIPYDGSAVYRKGAALAPQRIRTLSAAMPPVTEDGQVLQGLRVHDMGDLDPGPSIGSKPPICSIMLRRTAMPAPRPRTCRASCIVVNILSPVRT